MAKPPASKSGPKPKNEKLILALLNNSSFEKAAQEAQVSVTTLWRRSQTEEFQEQFRAARRSAFRQSTSRLQHASSAAVTTLLRVMTDQAAPHASRVRAAGYVLERSAQAMELEDIDARVQKLEQSKEDRKCDTSYSDD